MKFAHPPVLSTQRRAAATQDPDRRRSSGHQQEMAAGPVASMRAYINQSPRLAAQRRAIAAAFGTSSLPATSAGHAASAPVQRVASETGLKTEHVRKVYKNHLKGDPPFKPQHGNFGQVSWFKGTGNPYVGGQAQNYNLTVHVDLKGAARYQRDVFFEVLNDWDPDKTKRKNNAKHREFWESLGQALVGLGLSEVYVPQSPLSAQGRGTFFTADASAREQITLSAPDELRQHLGAEAVTIEQAVASADGTGTAQIRQPGFTVTAASLPPETDAWKRYGPVLGQVTAHTLTQVAAANPGWGSARKHDDTLALTYATYRDARQSAKQFGSILNSNRPQGVAVIAGTNWPANATRAYNINY